MWCEGRGEKHLSHICRSALKSTVKQKKWHRINTPTTFSVELLLASLLILLCQGYDHLEGLYALLISHVFLVHRLSFLSCKVQIILRLKSRLHIQYIVHGFCSIVHWLLFTLFSHISFHRKKIHYPLYQRWWMFSGLYDMGGGMGMGGWWGVNNCTYCFSGCHTIRLWGSNEKETFVLRHTHAYRLHIDHPICIFLRRSLVSKSWRRSSNKQSSESSHSHSANVFLTYSSRILQSVSSVSNCAVSSQDQRVIGAGIKHKTKPSQLPANNHSLHRFLSVFTVGHPSHGVDLLVGPSAGERWHFFRGCGAPYKAIQHLFLIHFVSTE